MYGFASASSSNDANASRRSAIWGFSTALVSPAVTLLAEVVTASRDLSETSSRSEKVAILAELLGRLEASEVAVAVGFLAGVPRQGRVGIGYSTVYGIEHASAPAPSLTVDDLDRVISEVQDTTGGGSGAMRRQ